MGLVGDKIEVRASGTLGDTYVVVCKLYKRRNKLITVHHKTKCDYWYNDIHDIYNLLSNIEVKFTDEENEDLPRISESPNIDIETMEFFPHWGVRPKLSLPFSVHDDFAVIQPHSGKPFDKFGGNTKAFSTEFIEDVIKQNSLPVVLLGTEQAYSQIDGCYNLIGQTNVFDIISILSHAKLFLGPEGFLSFVALSQKVNSCIFYTSQLAVDWMIGDTPWKKYAQQLIKI